MPDDTIQSLAEERIADLQTQQASQETVRSVAADGDWNWKAHAKA